MITADDLARRMYDEYRREIELRDNRIEARWIELDATAEAAWLAAAKIAIGDIAKMQARIGVLESAATEECDHGVALVEPCDRCIERAKAEGDGTTWTGNNDGGGPP